MVEVIIVLLLVSMLGFVLEPFYTGMKSESRFASPQEIKMNKLDYRKRELKATLAELELEHKSGMVSDEDYEVQKNDYNTRISAISNDLESMKSGKSAGSMKDRIEADIEKKKSGKKA